MKDFREVATTGWYGTPDTITPERAREIMDAVSDHIVSSVEDVWKSLTERAPDPGIPPPL
jgi:creatinine amidohydrolase/Fe(II)-dependent formamide hydrolase-like protein